MLLVRQILALAMMASVGWFSYTMGKLSGKSIRIVWLRYGIFLGIPLLLMVVLLTPLGEFWEASTDLTFERERLFGLSLNALWVTVVLIAMITVPGFVGIWIGSKSASTAE